MTYQTLQIEQVGATTVIRLFRPDSLNAYTVKMGEELTDAFDTLRDDDSCRVIILTGSGRGFCAGVDLKQLSQAPSPDDEGLPALGSERFVSQFADELFHYPKPIIAAINGAAIGVGVTMTLPCDIRLAADNAKLGIPFAKLGIVPGLGSTYLLPRLLGLGRAKLLAMSGRTLDADEAARFGLVDQVVPADEIMDAALSLAEEIGSAQPEVIRLIKEALNVGTSSSSLAASAAFEHGQNARR